LIEGQISQLDQ
jgi:transposase